eukprot:937551-Rhodomonas_salina.2
MRRNDTEVTAPPPKFTGSAARPGCLALSESGTTTSKPSCRFKLVSVSVSVSVCLCAPLRAYAAAISLAGQAACRCLLS